MMSSSDLLFCRASFWKWKGKKNQQKLYTHAVVRSFKIPVAPPRTYPVGKFLGLYLWVGGGGGGELSRGVKYLFFSCWLNVQHPPLFYRMVFYYRFKILFQLWFSLCSLVCAYFRQSDSEKTTFPVTFTLALYLPRKRLVGLDSVSSWYQRCWAKKKILYSHLRFKIFAFLFLQSKHVNQRNILQILYHIFFLPKRPGNWICIVVIDL